MESKWKKVKHAFGLLGRLRRRTNREEESYNKIAADKNKKECIQKNKQTFFSPPPSDYSIGHSASVSRSGLICPSASANKCAICLGTLKAGQGHAIFTAECGHSFHFQCIAAGVRHSQKCPICRAKWKEIPSKTTLSHAPPHTESPSSLPITFSDDEELLQSAPPTTKTPLIELKPVPEFPAVQRSSSPDNFGVLIHIKAPPTRLDDRASVDLVTVLDVSGSMAGTKLALLKKAMAFLIHNLSASDRLSLVAFSSSSRRMFPLRRMTPAGKDDALRAVNGLKSGGGTNIAGALTNGAKVIADRKWTNHTAGIMLLSDGRDTCQGRCESHLIPVHSFGFGSDHDAEFMHKISEASGGTYSSVETEGMIQDAFALCIGGLLSVVVQEMRVAVSVAHPCVKLQTLQAGRYSTFVGDDGKTGIVEMGDLYAEEERGILVNLSIPATELSGEMKLVKIECSYEDPTTKEAIRTGGEVAVGRPEVLGRVEAAVDVDSQRMMFFAAEEMKNARSMAERGKMKQARVVLENCLKRIRESAAFRQREKRCVSMYGEVEEMMGRMTTRHVYEESGRAYVLSGLLSHQSQRATARGDFSRSSGVAKHYQTASMVQMISRSQSFGMTDAVTCPRTRS